MKKLFIFLLILGALTSCTKNFVAENQNPYQISDELLKQDFTLLVRHFLRYYSISSGIKLKKTCVMIPGWAI